MKRIALVVILGLILMVVLAQVTRSPSAAEASAYFINLSDGDTVSSPLLIQFGLSGMGVAPAGAQFENTGHFHVLIDVDESTLDLNLPLPSTDNIRHFGNGQIETTLELSAGEHTLQLLLADFAHIPHDPLVMSEKITVNVSE